MNGPTLSGSSKPGNETATLSARAGAGPADLHPSDPEVAAAIQAEMIEAAPRGEAAQRRDPPHVAPAVHAASEAAEPLPPEAREAAPVEPPPDHPPTKEPATMSTATPVRPTRRPTLPESWPCPCGTFETIWVGARRNHQKSCDGSPWPRTCPCGQTFTAAERSAMKNHIARYCRKGAGPRKPGPRKGTPRGWVRKTGTSGYVLSRLLDMAVETIARIRRGERKPALEDLAEIVAAITQHTKS